MPFNGIANAKATSWRVSTSLSKINRPELLSLSAHYGSVAYDYKPVNGKLITGYSVMREPPQYDTWYVS